VGFRHPAIRRRRWRSNFGLTANIVTRICRHLRPQLVSAATSARSAWTVSTAFFATCAPIAVEASLRVRFVQRASGGPDCRSRNGRRPLDAFIALTRWMTLPPSPTACATSLQSRDEPSRASSDIDGAAIRAPRQGRNCPVL